MSLQQDKLVSLNVLVGTSLRTCGRCKNVSNRSTLLTYHLRHRDDLSAWSRTLILVTKMDKFYLGTRQYVKLVASTLLQRLKDVGLI